MSQAFATKLAPLLILLNAGVTHAQPRLENRPARSDEWGYRPTDGAQVRLNPPSLTWVHEPSARTYEVQWSSDADFRGAATARGFLWPTYTHHQPLAPGAYVWRYRYRDAEGKESNWSPARRFVIPADAVEFPMPSRAQQRAAIPEGHPRLFVRPEQLDALRAGAKGTARKQFETLREQADQMIAAGPTPEPEHRGSARDKDDLEAIKYWWPNREQTSQACQEAELIAFVALVSQEPRYRQAARQWVLHLASFDPDGPTNFQLNCEAGKPMLYRLPRAYDWAYDCLTEADRQAVRAVMARRIKDAWESGEVKGGVGHLNQPYSSHGNRVWHKIGEAGIAFLGEIPEAADWVDYSVNKFYACYPVWSDDDGGWHEGVSYWSGYMSKVVWWLQTAQVSLGIDPLRKPFFAQVGDFPLYVAPPGAPNMGFGDLSYRSPSSGTAGVLDYFLRAGHSSEGSHAAYWAWWAKQYGMKAEQGVIGFLRDQTLGTPPEPRAPTDLPRSKVFHGIGVASLHTSLSDSREDVHLLFKSSPFGSQSHGHNPQNSFQLNAYGAALLTTCVYRDLHGSPFHYQWAHSTVAHNAVLVDGQGQKRHTAAPQGRIVGEQFGDHYAYVAGDATEAYEGRLTRALRHVVLVQDPRMPFVVIVDELAAAQPSTYQFMLHALDDFQVRESETAFALSQRRAGLEGVYLATEPLQMRQWDGYDPKPRNEFPNQWHLEAGTAKPARQCAMLCVLVPYRDGQEPTWSATRRETPGALGAVIEIEGRRFDVAVRRADAQGPVQFEEYNFDGPVLVREVKGGN